MPTLTFLLPNQKKQVVEAQPGETLLAVALRHGIEIEHACGGHCACATCHVVVRTGYDTLTTPNAQEEDFLDQAWGVTPCSRLSCQTRIGEQPLCVEIPPLNPFGG